MPINKPIVGDNAFAHEAGIHQDGVLKHKQTYEIMTPESVGITGNRLVMGKHSGRHAFDERLKHLGFNLSKEDMNRAFLRFKELADKKKNVYDEDIEAIIGEEILRVPGQPDRYELLVSQRQFQLGWRSRSDDQNACQRSGKDGLRLGRWRRGRLLQSDYQDHRLSIPARSLYGERDHGRNRCPRGSFVHH